MCIHAAAYNSCEIKIGNVRFHCFRINRYTVFIQGAHNANFFKETEVGQIAGHC